MQLTITKQNNNTLLKRNEVHGKLIFEGATPSNANLTEAIAKELKTKAELVAIKHIYNDFSGQTAQFDAVAYQSVEAKQKTEPITAHIKKKLEEEKKKASEAQ